MDDLKFLFFVYYSRVQWNLPVPRIHLTVPDSHMDCDYLVSGTIYKVLLLIQSHSFAEYAPSLQSADFTSDQDMVLWHVSIRNDYHWCLELCWYPWELQQIWVWQNLKLVWKTNTGKKKFWKSINVWGSYLLTKTGRTALLGYMASAS